MCVSHQRNQRGEEVQWKLSLFTLSLCCRWFQVRSWWVQWTVSASRPSARVREWGRTLKSACTLGTPGSQTALRKWSLWKNQPQILLLKRRDRRTVIGFSLQELQWLAQRRAFSQSMGSQVASLSGLTSFLTCFSSHLLFSLFCSFRYISVFPYFLLLLSSSPAYLSY